MQRMQPRWTTVRQGALDARCIPASHSCNWKLCGDIPEPIGQTNLFQSGIGNSRRIAAFFLIKAVLFVFGASFLSLRRIPRSLPNLSGDYHRKVSPPAPIMTYVLPLETLLCWC